MFAGDYLTFTTKQLTLTTKQLDFMTRPLDPMTEPLDSSRTQADPDQDRAIERFVDHALQYAVGLPFVDLLPGQAALLGGDLQDHPHELVFAALLVMQGEPEKFPGSAPVLDEISRRQERAFAWQELIFHLESWLRRARNSLAYEQATAARLARELVTAYQEPDASPRTLAERLLCRPPTPDEQVPWIRRQIALLPLVRLLLRRKARSKPHRLRQKAVPAAPEKVPQTEKPQRPRRRRTNPLRRRMAHAQVLKLFTAALQDHIRARQKPR